MDETELRWQRLIRGLRDGDREVIREFCDQYGGLLEQVARKHLPPGVRRRVGPEDMVQSALRTFLRRARAGEFHLADSADLWRLLCAITLTKVREQTRFHLRQKRGLDQEVPAGWAPGADSGGDLAPTAPGLSPGEAAMFADQLEQFLAGLNDEERQVVNLKLQDCTNLEVADHMGCSERTVRRILKRVQAHLTQTLAEPEQ